MQSLIISLLILIPCAYFFLRYLEGDFSIKSIEEISKKVYDVSLTSMYGGKDIPKGQETIIVNKITYESGRIKYKTITFKS